MAIVVLIGANTPPRVLEAVIRQASAAQITDLAIRLHLAHTPIQPAPEAACAATAERIYQAGLRLDALHFIQPASVCSATADAAVRDQVIRGLDLAASVRARRIWTRVAAMSAGARYEDVHARALEALSALRFEAETRAVEILCPCAEAGFLLSPIETRDFFDHVNSPWVGAALEASRQSPSADLPDWIATLGRRLGCIQVRAGTDDNADADISPQRPTDVNWRAVFRALRAARCDATLVCADLDDARWLSDAHTRCATLD